MKLKICLIKLIIFHINLYKYCISPFLGKRCKYYPTCSDYAKEAIINKGIFKGTLLAMWRIARCNPFSYGGYDPVNREEYIKWKKEQL